MSAPESPAPSRETIVTLVAQAGLKPGPEQFEEICDAYPHVVAMVRRLQTHFAFADEPAHVFVPTKF